MKKNQNKFKLHIYDALKSYVKKRPSRFHMPGHKADRAFVKLFRQAPMDITELAFSDNLGSPEGVIAEAQKEVAEIMGAKKSFFLTDGSTSGVFAMLKVAKSFGNKIIISRNSHTSVYHACEMMEIEPYILNQNIRHNVIMPPTVEEIERLLSTNKDIAGVLLTSPDYFGNTVDYEKIKALVKKHRKLLMIDGAHGAHLRFVDRSLYAGEYADIWVDGLHKTMPCLTQGAVISTNNEKLIPLLEEAILYCRTTSPSYPIMASIEYAVKYFAANGDLLCANTEKYLSDFKTHLSMSNYRFYSTDDVYKLGIDFKYTGISPYLAVKVLEKRKIFVEFVTERYILCYLSSLNSKKDFVRLERALKKIARTKKLRATYKESTELKTGVKTYPYFFTLDMPKEYVSLSASVGRVCGKNAGIFPPCYPIVIAGETITNEVVDILSNEKNIFGIKNGKICVLKN